MIALLYGSLAFLLLGLVAFLCFAFYVWHNSTEETASMNLKIVAVSVAIGTVCMWLMWICTYMHQMNPIIFPILAGGE
jgi:V-type H+-transporting ATPase subunit e